MTTEENVTPAERFHLESWVAESYDLLASLRRDLHNAEVTLMACGPCDVAGMVAHTNLDRALVALSTALHKDV